MHGIPRQALKTDDIHRSTTDGKVGGLMAQPDCEVTTKLRCSSALSPLGGYMNVHLPL
jgi:hypothetical protein